MNRIAAVQRTGSLVHHPYLDIAIDGRPLDELAATALGDPRLGGLVPCLLDWYDGPEHEDELRVSRDRFLPGVGATALAPVLMCPDDADFWCTVILAEVAHEDDLVRWTRIGVDVREHLDDLYVPDRIGIAVRWADSFAGWEFDPVQYRAVFDAFVAVSH